MTRDDIIRMAREAGFVCSRSESVLGEMLANFAALVAAAEQRPISDVTEAVTKTVIEVEKLLCEKIGRQWQPSGMSIQTLVDELAALVAAAEREKFIDYPKGEVCGPCVCGSWPGGDCLRCPPTEEYLAAIRARGEP